MLIQLSDFVKDLRCGKYLRLAVQIVKNVQCRFDDTLKATKTARMTRAGLGGDKVLSPPSKRIPLAFALIYAPVHRTNRPLCDRFARSPAPCIYCDLSQYMLISVPKSLRLRGNRF